MLELWVLLNGVLFVEFFFFHCRTHRYDPVAKEWKYMTPMQKSRAGHACAVLNNQIYVLGGHDTISVERYGSGFHFLPNSFPHNSFLADTIQSKTSGNMCQA